MSVTLPVYLDHNATTPVDERVLEAMLPFFSRRFGNASSQHAYGREAKWAVYQGRSQIADLIGARPDDIVFTSGATESDNIALFGVAERFAGKGDHIITSVTEHKAVLDSARKLEQNGKKVTFLPVDSYGQVEPEAVRKAITPRTVLISIMAANNEIGTVADLKAIGQIAREHEVLFHSDGAQYVGHLPLDVNELNIDLLSISGHKLYGPKGIGALYVRPGLKIAPVIYGGGHERGMRSGTLNVPAIAGFGEAVAICKASLETEIPRLRALSQKLRRGISEQLTGVDLNGHPTQRLPHNLNLSIKGINSHEFVEKLEDIAISAGSACNASQAKPSHVISALGFGDERGISSLRFGLGRFTTEEEIDYVIEKIVTEVKTARSELVGALR